MEPRDRQAAVPLRPRAREPDRKAAKDRGCRRNSTPGARDGRPAKAPQDRSCPNAADAIRPHHPSFPHRRFPHISDRESQHGQKTIPSHARKRESSAWSAAPGGPRRLATRPRSLGRPTRSENLDQRRHRQRTIPTAIAIRAGRNIRNSRSRFPILSRRKSSEIIPTLAAQPPPTPRLLVPRHRSPPQTETPDGGQLAFASQCRWQPGPSRDRQADDKKPA
jgi:hypothetical protein